MFEPRIKLIVAKDQINGIGYKNDLINRNKVDMKYFKEQTMGHIVVMGRKTYESIMKPLVGRVNVIMSKKGMDKVPDGFVLVDSIEDVFKLAREAMRDVFIIGGSEIYKLWDQYIDEYHVTTFNTVKKADRYFSKYFFQDEFSMNVSLMVDGVLTTRVYTRKKKE